LRGIFGHTFWDLLDEHKSFDFWEWMEKTAEETIQAVDEYAEELGISAPHTVLTVKPAGTTSKLFMLTEGAHLPAMRYYVRWVQFQHGDPLIAQYEADGYPVQHSLKQYPDVAIVGFPQPPRFPHWESLKTNL